MKRMAYDFWLRLKYAGQERECKALLQDRLFAGQFRRIYFYHIRKTAGSSIIKAFLSVGGEDSAAVYRRLVRTPIHRTISGDNVIVGWRKFLIEGGHYSFAFSHIPFDELKLPPETFTFTIIRDPLKRAFSHYKILVNFARQDGPKRKNIVPELRWLGKTMDDFLDRIPKHALLNQLYMFSRNFDVDEAYDRVASFSHVMFTEDFNEGLQQLASKTGLALEPHFARRSSIDDAVDTSAMERLQEMVAPEFELYQRLRKEAAVS